MKNIEKPKLTALLEIMGSDPSQRILHFTKEDNTLTQMLHIYCQKEAYEFQINCIHSHSFDAIQKNYASCDLTKAIQFTLERPRYMIQGKVYNFIFVTLDNSEINQKEFLKKCHQIIHNGGHIILFLDKSEKASHTQWIQTLEESYYVATSVIDDLFENYDVVISKKMHGWGDK